MTWTWLNLAAPEFAEPVEPPDLCGLIYPGLRHVISGHPESTKTLVASILSLTAQRQGATVAHLDLELGARRTRALLGDLGATAEEIHAIFYTEPGGPPDADDIGYIVDKTVGFVFVNAAAGAFGVSGLDDHARKDVERFGQAWIEPLYRASVTTLLVDHVVKSTENRGKWAIGSERKAGVTDVHLGLELVGNPLTRGGTALVKVRVHKDRPGWLNRPYATELALTSDPETHRITWEWRHPNTVGAGERWRPTVYMERVSQHLEQHGPMSRTSVYAAGLGKREHLVTAIQCLLDEGNLTEDGSASFPQSPFRHDEARSRVPKPFPAVPGTEFPPRSHRSPSYKEGTGNGEPPSPGTATPPRPPTSIPRRCRVGYAARRPVAEEVERVAARAQVRRRRASRIAAAGA